VTWAQIHAFRLQRHNLARKAPRKDLVKVAGETGGMQAQVMSAAELQLAVRCDCSTRDVRDALWKDRALVKTWLMRGTLHLIPAEELPLYAAATSTRWVKPRPSWLKYFNVTEAHLAELSRTIGDALDANPKTREEVLAIAGKGQPPRVRESLKSGWGGLLKPAARSGLLCFGPNRGQSVTFVRPELWLHSWRTMDPEAALVEVARRYLRAYGPARKHDFARWWGHWPGVGTAAWEGLAGELVPVSVEGTSGDILEADLEVLTSLQPETSVRLLPLFDPYLMGHRDRSHMLDLVHSSKVSRIAGWISAVVLAGGRVEGTWTHATAGNALKVVVEPFRKLSPKVLSEVRLRAEELGAAMGLARCEVKVSSPARSS
jgi:Winged helix DNA-binding domain